MILHIYLYYNLYNVLSMNLIDNSIEIIYLHVLLHSRYTDRHLYDNPNIDQKNNENLYFGLL